MLYRRIIFIRNFYFFRSRAIFHSPFLSLSLSPSLVHLFLVYSPNGLLLLFRRGGGGGLLLDLFRSNQGLAVGFRGKNRVGIGANLHERAPKISLNRRRKCSAVCQRTRLACLFNRKKESISRAHLSPSSSHHLFFSPFSFLSFLPSSKG